MTEIGIFNDEGLVEGQFYTEEQAKAAITDRYSEEDDLTVEAICHEHEEQRAASCEECFSDDDDDDEDDEL